MHDMVTVLQQSPPWLVYVLAAVLVAGETAVIVGLLVPAEATLLLVGFLAYAGTLRLVPAAIIMIVAAAIGDGWAYRSGRRRGAALREGRWGARVGADRWTRAEALINRLGGRGVLAARWLAFVRTLAPRLAGAAGMPYRRFAAWNLAGGAGWVGSTVVVGYLAGESYRRVSDLLGKATGAVLALLAGIVVLVLVGRWLGRNPDPVRALADRTVALPPSRWLARRYGSLVARLSARIGAGWTLLLNLLSGLALLFGLGLALAWLLTAVIRHSGLSVVDGAISGWFADRRTPAMAEAAVGVLAVLRGPVLILAVAILTLALGGRAGGRPLARSGRAGDRLSALPETGRGRTSAWRTDLVGVLGTAGAFVPLMLLAMVADLTQPDRGEDIVGPVPITLFPTQNAVVSASLCTMAWLLARGRHWPAAVAAWTGAAVGIVTVVTARLYLGWSTASETVTSVLLGVFWTVFFIVAWASRDRALRTASPRERSAAR
ncbi:DedA family protein [Plantactinospora sp. GCM10030261]|uniref:DedA family protein n=1 Tax=Plantactinospora sp. GCM10030261 TaxID=3273420 RepID=UPI00361C68D1